MHINEVIKLIEDFAPLELQASWDNSGWAVDFGDSKVEKVLLCLSVTEDIVNQALEKNCDMIISHHPLFFVPLELNKGVPIYTAHTNLDCADGGTTDTVVELLGFDKAQKIGNFLRLVELENEFDLKDFIELLKNRLQLKAIRLVNKFNCDKIKKIAFCAGSGMDFLKEAQKSGADAFVTGDIKYHGALDSKIILIDIEHFESERPVLNSLKRRLTPLNLEVIIADEKSPFITC